MGCKSSKPKSLLHPEVLTVVRATANVPSSNQEFTTAVQRALPRCSTAADVLKDDEVATVITAMREQCNLIKPLVFQAVKRHHASEITTAEGKRQLGTAIVEHANQLLEADCLDYIDGELNRTKVTAQPVEPSVVGTAAEEVQVKNSRPSTVALDSEVLNAVRIASVIPSENKEFAAAVQKALPRCSTAADVLNDSEVAAAVATMREQCNVIKPSVFQAAKRCHGSEIGTSEGKRQVGAAIVEHANILLEANCLDYIDSELAARAAALSASQVTSSSVGSASQTQPPSSQTQLSSNPEESVAEVRLPPGKWVKTMVDNLEYYYSQEENLYFHPATGHFYDPTTEMWYDPAKDEWYQE